MPWGGGTCWQEAALSAAAGRAGKGCSAQTPRGGNHMYSRFIAVVAIAIRIMCFYLSGMSFMSETNGV